MLVSCEIGAKIEDSKLGGNEERKAGRKGRGKAETTSEDLVQTKMAAC